MAETKEAVAVVPPKDYSVAPAPDYVKSGDTRGLEGITRADITVPRLALAQAMSPQVTEGDPHLIPNLKPGDLFNSVTGQIYGGRKPVYVQLLRRNAPRAMQFKPIDEGGGILEPDVPLNDPRLKWGDDGSKPEATLFLDFFALILPQRELVALSFKSSGIKVAKELNRLMLFKGHAIFTGKYAISTGIEQKPKPHQIYKVEDAGWVTEEEMKYGEKMYEAVKSLDVTVIDRDQTTDDILPEDTVVDPIPF